jgi:hypothetical protein
MPGRGEVPSGPDPHHPMVAAQEAAEQNAGNAKMFVSSSIRFFREQQTGFEDGHGRWTTLNGERIKAYPADDPLAGFTIIGGDLASVTFGVRDEATRPVAYWTRMRPHQELEIVSSRPSDVPIPAHLRGRRPTIGLYDAPYIPAFRSDNAQLIAIASAYFDAMERGSAEGVPFDASCERFDNGIQLTHQPALSPLTAGDCADSMRTFRPITRVRDRQYPVVHTGRDLVFASAIADAPAASHADPRTNPPVTRELAAASLRLGLILWMSNGRIMYAETIWRDEPPGATTGWPAP